MTMEQLVQFFLNHPVLTAAFFALAGALAWMTLQPGGRSRISPADVTRMISHEDAVVLDVRADGEFRNGHIVNAVHVPEEQLVASLKKLEKFRGRPIITACRSGQRSVAAIKILKGLGFERLYSLNGGMTAWEGAKLPLSKGN